MPSEDRERRAECVACVLARRVLVRGAMGVDPESRGAPWQRQAGVDASKIYLALRSDESRADI